MNLFWLFQLSCLFFRAYGSPIIIAHRGASAHAPENTLQAFELAIKKGAKIIELDVHLTNDQQLVVIHDDSVERTTNGRGTVVNLTLEQIQKLDAGQGQVVPTLAQVVDFVAKRAIINIELKGSGTANSVARLISDYHRRGWQFSNFLVSSFDHDALVEFHEFLPQVKLGKLFEFGFLKNFFANFFNLSLPSSLFSDLSGVQFIGIPINLATTKNIKTIHDHNLVCYVYTINNQKELDSLQNVDGVFSDYLDLNLVA
jgi:glycerophosphoryl diester phosphodiesterase